MFPRLSPLRAAGLYYLLTVGMVIVVALTGASTAVAMLTPAVAALLMLLVLTRQGWTRHGWASLGLHRSGIRYWPVAVLVPLFIVVLGAVVIAGTDAARWQPSSTAAGLGPRTLFGYFLVNVLYASLTVSLTEEIGWRGYLLPHLADLGNRRALLLSGLMHGVWHLPVILLTSLYHPVGSRWVVVPMFLVAVTALGVFYGWMRLRTGSIWPAVLAHSAHNVAIAWMGQLLAGDAVAIQYVAGEGAVTMAAYVAIAAVLLHRRDKPAAPATGVRLVNASPIPSMSRTWP